LLSGWAFQAAKRGGRNTRGPHCQVSQLQRQSSQKVNKSRDGNTNNLGYARAAFRNWRTAGGTEVRNKDLWEDLDSQVRRLAEVRVQVLFWRIPWELNEADKYAKEAAVSMLRCRRDPSSHMVRLRFSIARHQRPHQFTSWRIDGA